MITALSFREPVSRTVLIHSFTRAKKNTPASGDFAFVDDKKELIVAETVIDCIEIFDRDENTGGIFYTMLLPNQLKTIVERMHQICTEPVEPIPLTELY